MYRFVSPGLGQRRDREGKRLLPCTLIMFLPFKLFSPRAISPSLLLLLLLSFFIRDIISRPRKQQQHPPPAKVVAGDFFQFRQGREGELGEAAAEGDWQKNGG